MRSDRKARISGLAGTEHARNRTLPDLRSVWPRKIWVRDYLSSYYESQARHLYAKSALKISSYYLIKVCGSFYVVLIFFLKKKNWFFCLYEKYVFSPVPFLCMMFTEITFCCSINLEQPVMVLVLFFLTYQLSCGMRYLILSVPMSLLVLKENQGPHFVQRLFFLMNISLNIMYLVGICIFYVF